MSGDPSQSNRDHAGIPQNRAAGDEVWRLRHPDGGRVQACEICHDQTGGEGWSVLILENGEPIFARSCVDESEARYVARVLSQDTVRSGWTETT